MEKAITSNESTRNGSIDMQKDAGDVTRNLKIAQMCIYALFVVVGVFVNTLVCRTILLQPKKRTNDLFILNLAITDLGTCAVSVPFDMAERLTEKFPFGKFMCNVIYPLQTILIATSVFTLLAMSIERYKAIVTPLRPKLRGKLAKAMMLGSWVLAVVVVVPYIAILEFNNGLCIENWPLEIHAKVYTFTLFIILYVAPLTVITRCYAKVLRRIHKDKRNISKLAGASLRRGGAAKRRAEQNLRMVKIFVTAVVAFALCLLPNHAAWLWYDFGSGGSKPYFGIILIFSGISIYANSLINPFIFGKLKLRAKNGKQLFSLRSLSIDKGSGGNSWYARQRSLSVGSFPRGPFTRRMSRDSIAQTQKP